MEICIDLLYCRDRAKRSVLPAITRHTEHICSSRLELLRLMVALYAELLDFAVFKVLIFPTIAERAVLLL